MRTTKSISITFPTAMAKEAARRAKRESRTVSDLMREAFRRYCNSSTESMPDDRAEIIRTIADAKMNPLSAKELAAEDRRLMAIGAALAKQAGTKERDVVRVIHESRARRSAP